MVAGAVLGSTCWPCPRRLVRSESRLSVQCSSTLAGSPWMRSCSRATLRLAYQARFFAGIQRAMAARVGLRVFNHPLILVEIRLAAGMPVCPGRRVARVHLPYVS